MLSALNSVPYYDLELALLVAEIKRLNALL
jgi:hypothetical protein